MLLRENTYVTVPEDAVVVTIVDELDMTESITASFAVHKLAEAARARLVNPVELTDDGTTRLSVQAVLSNRTVLEAEDGTLVTVAAGSRIVVTAGTKLRDVRQTRAPASGSGSKATNLLLPGLLIMAAIVGTGAVVVLSD